jgi:hypothetical protein
MAKLTLDAIAKRVIEMLDQRAKAASPRGEMSSADLRDELLKIANTLDREVSYVMDVFSNTFVVHENLDTAAPKFYEIEYTINENGEVGIGKRDTWREVRQVTRYEYADSQNASIVFSKSAKGTLFIGVASGAYLDNDTPRERFKAAALRDFAERFAQNGYTRIDGSGEKITLDWAHQGFRSNKNPNADERQKIILGHIEGATYENNHLVVAFRFNDEQDAQNFSKVASDFALSLYWSDSQPNADGEYETAPNIQSVALLPRGYQAYPYSSVTEVK